MQFKPEPITSKAFKVVPKGEYKFNVLEAKDSIVKSGQYAGNDMISLKLEVFDDNGNKTNVFANLLGVQQVGAFCQATGLMDRYNHGSLLSSDCLHKSGKCFVDIQEKTLQYPEKNRIAYYIKRDDAPDYVPVDDFTNDDVPF